MEPESESIRDILRLVGRMALYVIPGTALVAILWETLNLVLAWDASPWRLAWALPLGLALVHLVWILSQRVRAW